MMTNRDIRDVPVAWQLLGYHGNKSLNLHKTKANACSLCKIYRKKSVLSEFWERSRGEAILTKVDTSKFSFISIS